MKKRTIAYARVSTCMQSTGLEAQVRAIREYCKRSNIDDVLIFQDENQSGMKKSRPALDEMMKKVRAGECERVIVYSFSRFARSVSHLLNALQEFEKLGVKFISISESIDTDTPIGRALFTILGSVSQLERDILVERVKNGLANAKAKGVRIGRKKTRPSEMIRRLRMKGLTFKEIARLANCSSGAVASEIKLWAKEKEMGIETIEINKDIPPVETSTEALDTIENPTPATEAPLEIVRF